MRVPFGYLSSISSQGFCSFCFRPREMRSFSRLTSSTNTSSSWPTWTTSLGWLMRPQLMSVMCSRPSMPLRSTNAPKSVMFFTTPRRVWPGWISSSSFFFCSRRVSSIRSRRDSTMLRRSLLILMTLHSRVWPRKSSRLRAGTTSICEPGRNASTPPTSTSRPPLTLPLTTPLTTLPSSQEAVTLSQLRCCSARDLLSTTMPCSSSRRSSSTSTSSPTWISLRSLNSDAGSSPSDL